MVPSSGYKRMGVLGDGGYVVWLGEGCNRNDFDAYISAGIGTEESFTWDFLTWWRQGRRRGQNIPAYAFDGTVETYPIQYVPHGAYIEFIKRNIGAKVTDTCVNLHRLIAQYHDIFLKMDIEGGEYEWLVSLTDEQMIHFREIVVEFHDINTTKDFPIVWDKIQKTHWIVHIHGNNYGGVRIWDGRPNVIEVTLVKKGINTSELELPKWDYIAECDIHIHPIIGLDWPNCSMQDDLVFSSISSPSSKAMTT